MFKFVFSAVVCAAMCMPVAAIGQDCGCCDPAPNPCVKTRKKLKVVEVQQEVCRRKRVCSTDECGCPTSKIVQVKETVCRKKLTLEEVPVDPCRKGLLKRLRGRVASVGGRLGQIGCRKPACGCDAPAPATCGCDAAPAPAPASCGCDAAAAPSVMAAPVEMMAPVDMAPVDLAPMAAPASSCCGG